MGTRYSGYSEYRGYKTFREGYGKVTLNYER